MLAANGKGQKREGRREEKKETGGIPPT